MFEYHTATQLAEQLDRVQGFDPQYTGPLSLLDEAALRWTIRFPDLSATLWAFSQARGRHNLAAGRDNWTEIVTTSQALAKALRQYGDVRLQFCGERSVYGTCHGQVHNGPCPRANDHVTD